MISKSGSERKVILTKKNYKEVYIKLQKRLPRRKANVNAVQINMKKVQQNTTNDSTN